MGLDFAKAELHENENSDSTEKTHHQTFPIHNQNTALHNFALQSNPTMSFEQNATNTLSMLPEHTQRLVLAQNMLNRQLQINQETNALIHRRRVALLRRLAARKKEQQDRDEAAKEEFKKGQEVDATLQEAEQAMQNKRGFKSVAKHLSSVRKGLSLTTSVPETKTKKPTKTQLRMEAQRNAFEVADKTSDGLVDLTPQPRLPPVPDLKSVENPRVSDDKHVYAVSRNKMKSNKLPLSKASQAREAVLAAVSVIGDENTGDWRTRYQSENNTRNVHDDVDVFSEQFDSDEDSDSERDDKNEKNTYVRYRRKPSHSRYDGMASDSGDSGDDVRVVRRRERERLEKASETHAFRLEKDAAESMRVGKFTKAEHHLRQLAALRGASLSRGEKPGYVYPKRTAGALAKLAQAVLATHSAGMTSSSSRLEEVHALCVRALRALRDGTENFDQVTSYSDDESATFLFTLDVARAGKGSENDPESDNDALAYAKKGLTFCNFRFGAWDVRVADWSRKTAMCLLRSREGPRAGTFVGGAESLAETRDQNNVPVTSHKALAIASAIDLLKRALEICKRVLGAGHSETLRCMCELATAHRRAGEFPRAERLYTERRKFSKRWKA